MKIKNLLNKRILGTIPLFALIAIVGVGGIASAALLHYYGSITGMAAVSQSVLVDGKDIDTQETDPIGYSYTETAGSTVVEGPHTLTNNAEEPATVSFKTTYSPDGKGITTTYQLVTSLLGKNGGKAEWVSTAKSGDYGVKLTMPAEDDRAKGWSTGGHVKIPVDISDISTINSGSLIFYAKGIDPSTAGFGSWWGDTDIEGAEGDTRGPYYQLMIDLGDDVAPEDRFVNVVPTSWSATSVDGWYKIIPSDKWYSFDWKETAETEDYGPHTLSEWDNKFSDLEKNTDKEYKVYWVSIQYGWAYTKGESSTSVTVDKVSFDGKTWDLEQDDLQSLDLGNNPTLTIPPDKEKYDFQITNDFAIDLKPDTYTITTKVAPVKKVESGDLSFSSTGWGGWSCPEGTVVVGGGHTCDSVQLSQPAKPGVGQYPDYPHYSYSDGETGWVVQNDGDSETCRVYAFCAPK